MTDIKILSTHAVQLRELRPLFERSETCIDIGRSGLGIVVRQGAAKPDITTVDAFQRALLAAPSAEH